MEFELEDNIHYEFIRRLYWARILVRDEQGIEGKALIAANRNYLTDNFHLHPGIDVSHEHKVRWLQEAIGRLQREMPEVISDEPYYQVDSLTLEGMTNGLEFLQSVVP